ncbi:sensor domain-containing diguanylate cyclase [Saccharibacillus sp. CPCC 101409]|uniref:sensor domain-containing diguanylate cyclase n=1 Tax=Saccharibacillus sp. CPCC 101409 TaxID=3058041 RepID=UPI002672027F|nr:sensor domain-containing diguanylate cyclase [Saccharibacillus sp. CPCC 101409]MDO3411414.1 sensor domain-containing diguanylate cyclase [Saccharibacillus sp. CPCC 101409]
MKNKIRVSLRGLFSMLVVLSFLLTLGITLLSSYRASNELMFERTLETNRSESERVSRTMNTLFVSIRKSLSAFTGEIASQTPKHDAEALREKLKLIYRSSGYFSSVFAADADGKVVELFPGTTDSDTKLIDADALEKASGRKAAALSSPYIAQGGEMTVLMTEPVYGQGGVYLGMIGGTISLQEPNLISGIFGSNGVDRNGSYYYIVDSEGMLIYHPDKTLIGRNISDNLVVQRLRRHESGSGEITNMQGVSFLAGYTYVSANRWGVVSQTPISVLMEQQQEQIRRTLAASILPFVGLALGTLFLARRLAAPFVLLADQVVRAAKRPQDASIPAVRRHWNREADLLNRAVLLAVGEMKRQNRDLIDSAMKDPLTGLMNRRALDEALEKMEGDNRPFSLLIVDIDRFKTVNDRYGHTAGDEVLKAVAHTLETTVEARDLCGRYGGEEFVVLLPGRSVLETYEMAERLREAVATSRNKLRIPVTVSIGAAISPLQSSRSEDLFELADQALYRAKKGGRNCVVV